MIKNKDIISSVADALQFISYYHSDDFIQAMTAAYELEQSKPAKDAMLQILTSSKLSALGKRPLCQDTGIVTIFVEVGMCAKLEGDQVLEDLINQGVSQAYLNVDNPLRASIVMDPLGKRSNTKDNTPAVIHTRLVQGDKVSFRIAAKGGGSENKAHLKMMNPSDDIVSYILDLIPQMGAGWCPPGVIGIGVGGTAEKAVIMAKESLMDPINIQELIHRGATNKTEELRLELYTKINKLGIGAQGLGGLTTVLDVKIKDYPTHAASLPVAIIPNCAATRHIHFELDGSGPADLIPPKMNFYPKDEWQPNAESISVNINQITKHDLSKFKVGDTLLLSGKILTARDAAHKRIMSLIDNGQELPVTIKDRFIYYVGPVDPIGDEAVGPAGPTTATRMDQFTEEMLNQGILGMIGKAERSQATVDLIQKHQATYMIAVGGAAFLVSKAIKKAKKIAFEELGMEAIYEFEVEDMPVTVAVDQNGRSIHTEGPKQWKIVAE
ncbi:MAG: fumarate hydratase [Methylophilaceae bacterium]|jgi:fumarate hydratase, class I